MIKKILRPLFYYLFADEFEVEEEVTEEDFNKRVEERVGEIVDERYSAKNILKTLYDIDAYDFESLDQNARSNYMRQVADFYNSTAWSNELNSMMKNLNYSIIESETMEDKEFLKKMLLYLKSLDERWRKIDVLLEQETNSNIERQNEIGEKVKATGIQYRDII